MIYGTHDLSDTEEHRINGLFDWHITTTGLNPVTIPDLKGTVGVIFSDPAGSNRIARLYWFDKQTDLVSDVPSESRLETGRFGPIAVGK